MMDILCVVVVIYCGNVIENMYVVYVVVVDVCGRLLFWFGDLFWIMFVWLVVKLV